MTSSTMRLKDDQNPWNFIFSILFVALAVLSGLSLYKTYGGLPQGIDVFDAVLIALAVFRLTRLVIYDKIMRFFREWFVKKKDIPASDSSPAYVELIPYKSGPARAMYELLRCPWCIGIWASLAVVYAYFTYSWAWYAVVILAIAGLASFVQLLTNFIGWKAELGKLETQEKEKGMDSTC